MFQIWKKIGQARIGQEKLAIRIFTLAQLLSCSVDRRGMKTLLFSSNNSWRNPQNLCFTNAAGWLGYILDRLYRIVVGYYPFQRFSIFFVSLFFFLFLLPLPSAEQIRKVYSRLFIRKKKKKTCFASDRYSTLSCFSATLLAIACLLAWGRFIFSSPNKQVFVSANWLALNRNIL